MTNTIKKMMRKHKKKKLAAEKARLAREQGSTGREHGENSHNGYKRSIVKKNCAHSSGNRGGCDSCDHLCGETKLP